MRFSESSHKIILTSFLTTAFMKFRQRICTVPFTGKFLDFVDDLNTHYLVLTSSLS